MNSTSKFTLPAVLDPVFAAVMEQLQQKVEAKDRVIAERNQALAAAEAIIHQLKEALRLERIRSRSPARSTRAATNCQAILNASKRSSPARPSSAAAAPRPA